MFIIKDFLSKSKRNFEFYIKEMKYYQKYYLYIKVKFLQEKIIDI